MKTTSEGCGVRHAARVKVALVALCMVAACSTKNETVKTDSAGGMVGATTAAAGASTGATAAAQPASPSSYTDPQILGATEGADSAEIALGKVAEKKASNAGVKAFAQMLVADHSKAAKQAKQLESKASLNAQTPPGDTTSAETSHLVDRFNGIAKGMDFDTAFVNHEVDDHQHDLDDTKSMIDAAQNPQVKQMLQSSLPVLQKHLDRAKALQKQLEKSKS